MKTTLSELAAAIRKADHFLLLTHRRPDGDTTGSAAALCAGLRAIGKQAAVLENPEVTPKYQPFLDGLTTPELPAAGKTCTLFAVDVASESMLLEGAASLAGQIELCVDHHGSNTGFAALSCIVPAHAACGETVLELLELLGAPLTQPMAAALYLALCTDTGCFRFSNTTPNTLRRAAQLQEAGAPAFTINRQFATVKTLARLKLEAMLGGGLEILAEGRVAICVLTPQMLEACHATEDDIEDLANFPRQIDGVEAAVYIRQLPTDSCKISLRTDPGIDASAICAHLGGGGHAAAAGATVTGGIPQARTAILDAIRAETAFSF